MHNTIGTVSSKPVAAARHLATRSSSGPAVANGPRDTVTSGPGAGQPTYQQLLERNRQLEAELSKAKAEVGPIRLDPANDKLTIVGLKTHDFEISHLEVKVSALGDYLGDALSIETLLENQGQLPLPPVDQLARSPMTVDALKLKIPAKTLQKSSELMGKDAMRRNGIKELSIRPEAGNRLHMRGTIDKLVDIPFDISGELAVSRGNEIHFKAGKTKVFGFLPVPNLVMRIAASLAGRDMEQMGVQQRGDTFVFDADDFLPQNVRLELTRIGTEDDGLVLEGRAPKDLSTSPASRNPTTLAALD
jgi:hypothetical protein